MLHNEYFGTRQIPAAHKARWAKQKGTLAPKKVAAPARKAIARKPMSSGNRKILAALMKALGLRRRRRSYVFIPIDDS